MGRVKAAVRPQGGVIHGRLPRMNAVPVFDSGLNSPILDDRRTSRCILRPLSSSIQNLPESRVSRSSDLPELDDLVRRLPFRLDALDEVGALFERWLARPGEGDEYLLTLWTYCYVRRYFLVRFAREPSFTGGDLEEVVELTYRRIEENKRQIRSPVRYARWVVVVCRNTYFSFVSHRPERLSIDRIAEPEADVDDLETWHEGAGLRSALVAAVDRLPSFLRPYATLKFLEGLEYETVAVRMARDVPTVRTYVHRAVMRLRKDRRFMRWIHDTLGYETGFDESWEK